MAVVPQVCGLLAEGEAGGDSDDLAGRMVHLEPSLFPSRRRERGVVLRPPENLEYFWWTKPAGPMDTEDTTRMPSRTKAPATLGRATEWDDRGVVVIDHRVCSATE